MIGSPLAVEPPPKPAAALLEGRDGSGRRLEHRIVGEREIRRQARLLVGRKTDGAQLAAKLVIDIAGDRHMRVEHQG
jgi:hypothetical protein